jgi:hypothetical protein
VDEGHGDQEPSISAELVAKLLRDARIDVQPGIALNLLAGNN